MSQDDGSESDGIPGLRGYVLKTRKGPVILTQARATIVAYSALVHKHPKTLRQAEHVVKLLERLHVPLTNDKDVRIALQKITEKGKSRLAVKTVLGGYNSYRLECLGFKSRHIVRKAKAALQRAKLEGSVSPVTWFLEHSGRCNKQRKFL